MMQKDVTLQHPEERPNIPDNYRGVPTLVKDPNGRKCVSANSASSFVRPKRFVSHLARLTLKQSLSAPVEKSSAGTISTCSAASTGLCQEVCPKRRFCRMLSHSLATVVGMINKKENFTNLVARFPTNCGKWDKRKPLSNRATALILIHHTPLRICSDYADLGAPHGGESERRERRYLHDHLFCDNSSVFLLEAYFPAVQVLVYAGAVMGFFFSSSCCSMEQDTSDLLKDKMTLGASITGFTLLVILTLSVFTGGQHLPETALLPVMENPTVRASASLSLPRLNLSVTVYLLNTLPFRATGFLLLAAMIGVIVVSKNTLKIPTS